MGYGATADASYPGGNSTVKLAGLGTSPESIDLRTSWELAGLTVSAINQKSAIASTAAVRQVPGLVVLPVVPRRALRGCQA